MSQQAPEGSNRHQSDRFERDKMGANESGRVPPAERERIVLEFIDEHNIALPPAAIFRGLKVQRNVPFSYRTVQNILKRLAEEGEVMRVDKDALDEGEIRPLPEDATGRRTYYFITDAGRERLGRSG